METAWEHSSTLEAEARAGMAHTQKTLAQAEMVDSTEEEAAAAGAKAQPMACLNPARAGMERKAS